MNEIIQESYDIFGNALKYVMKELRESQNNHNNK